MSKSIWLVAVVLITAAVAIMLRDGCAGAAEPAQVQAAAPVNVAPSSVHVQVPATPYVPPLAHSRVLVSDSEGHPIASAEIREPEVPERAAYVTDARGEAVLVGCGAGVHRLRITCRGFIGVDTCVEISEQAVARVTLLNFASVIGTVTNARGDTIEGATIKAEYSRAAEPASRFMVSVEDDTIVRRTAVSAANGRFEIPRAIPDRQLVIHASHPQYGSIALPMQTLAPNVATTCDIQLPDATGLRGVLALGPSRGEPVTLHIWHAQPDKHFLEKLKTLSVPAFEPFEVRDLPVGSTLVLAQASEAGRLVVAARQVVVQKGQMTDAGDVSPGSSVLRVTCGMDTETRSRRIQLSFTALQPPAPITHLPCKTEVSGAEATEFTVVGLPDGLLDVEATVLDRNSTMPDMSYEYEGASKRVTCTNGTHVSLTISARKPEGELIVSLQPPPGTLPEILSAFVWLESSKGVTDTFSRPMLGNNRFRFSLRDLPGEEVTLRAVAHGYSLARTDIVVAPGKTESVALSGWTKGELCDGIVVDEDGNPVAGASLVCTAPSRVAKRPAFMTIIQGVSTDEQGRFTIEALPRCAVLQILAHKGSARSAPYQFGADSASGLVLELKKVQK